MVRFLVVGLVLLCGCLADNNSRLGRVDDNRVVVNIPELDGGKVADVVSGKLSSEFSGVRTDVSNNNSQLSGQVNGMIHEIRTDVGKFFDKLMENNFSISNTFNSSIQGLLKVNNELRVQLESSVSANVKLRAELNAQLSVVNELRLSNNRLEVELKANVQGAANAQIGKNYFEQSVKDIRETITSSAGRDVNMFPKEAVEVMISSWKMFSLIISILCGAAVSVISIIMRGSRNRADVRYREEKKRGEDVFGRLNRALVHVPADKLRDI